MPYSNSSSEKTDSEENILTCVRYSEFERKDDRLRLTIATIDHSNHVPVGSLRKVE